MNPVSDLLMPDRLKLRPRDRRGYPIPVTNEILEDGTPDFTRINFDAVRRVVEKELCSLCGESLEYWKAFIGGPLAIRNRTFTDPGMHIDCGHYAMRVCPFLAMPSTIYARRLKGPVDPLSANQTLSKPPAPVMAIVRKYTFRLDQGRIFIPAPKEIRVYPYGSQGIWYVPTAEVFASLCAESDRRAKEDFRDRRAVQHRDWLHRHGATG